MTVTLGTLHAVPITQLRGVGSGLHIKLQRLNLQSITDLLLHLPRSYEDRRQVTPIAQLMHSKTAKVVAKVCSIVETSSRKPSIQVVIADHSGQMNLRFFNVRKNQLKLIPRDKPYSFFGEVRCSAFGKEMVHPEFHSELIENEGLVPIYPLTDGLSQLKIRQLIHQALKLLDPDALHAQTLSLLHQPNIDMDFDKLCTFTHPLQQQLVLHELASQQFSLLQSRVEIRKRSALSMEPDMQLHQAVIERFGFTPTAAQQRVVQEIFEDLRNTKPMLRLLQGDVGSGKTAVAALVLAQCLGAGWQVAIMAPTDLLAEQLYRNLYRWLHSDSAPLLYLNGHSSKEQRLQVANQLQLNSACALIGTHALFQENLRFQKLSLIIIDEQHRFGVEQRLALRNKAPAGQEAHLLIMTATPIPRTLSMSLTGDLDTSLLDEQPPGRQPISTIIIAQDRQDEVIQRVTHHCTSGHRAYWVCTLIDESEKIAAQAAEQRLAYLQEHMSGLRLALIHGRIAANQRIKQMQAFANGDLDLLVATTVIEVGVDVPEATLMIIENPERLGLSQLHQLRGRVGRGQQPSFCILLYGTPLSQLARQRLTILRQSQNGFEIAEQDLLLRGPGEIMGIRQSGLGHGRIFQLDRDWPFLDSARQLAQYWLTGTSTEQQIFIEPWISVDAQFTRV